LSELPKKEREEKLSSRALSDACLAEMDPSGAHKQETKIEKIALALALFLSLSLALLQKKKNNITSKKKRILIHSFTSLSLSLSPPRDERTPAHEQLPVDI
jgi:hypothetical protein